MKLVCEITFFLTGETKKIFVVPDNYPLNKDEAETIAWTAIRGWFEARQTEIPEIVRNVRMDDVKEYQWDVLPLSSSMDKGL